MRVLFLLGIGFDEQTPSLHLMSSIIRECIKDNIFVHVIVRSQRGKKQNLPREFLDSSFFKYDVVYTNNVKKNNFILRYINEVKYAYRCRKQYSTIENVDVTFVQSNTVSYFMNRLIKKTLQSQIVFNVQDIFPNNLYELKKGRINTVLYGFLLSLQKKGYYLSDKIITISDDMKETLVSIGVEKEKINVIYNWSYSDSVINTKKQDNIFYKSHFSNETFNVVYAGNVGVVQNVEIILRASRVLEFNQAIHFYIIGNGSKKDFLIKKYKNENVTFIDSQPMETAESIYSSADLLIIPLAQGIIKTALPSKTATCLRTQVPIIFCIDKESIFSKLVSKESGVYVCDTNSEIELADCISSLFNNRQIVNERKIVSNLMSSDENPTKYVEVLRGLKQ